MRLCKFENFPVPGKISDVDSGFKGHLQDKPMQWISETMDNGLCKVRTRLESGITNWSKWYTQKHHLEINSY